MKSMKKLNIDVIRLVMAFMIVAIHTYPFECISNSLDFIITRVLFRVAVPFFLMITGYFVLAKDNKEKIIKYTSKIIKIYLLSIILYLPINIYNGYFSNFHIVYFFKDIFFTGTLYHLWYFPALILGLWISYFLIHKLTLKKALAIALTFYVIGIFGDSYYGLVNNVPIINSFYKLIFLVFDYTRNGIFYVPIFLLMGYAIKKNKSKVLANKYCYVFVLTLLIEGIITLKFNLYHHSSMYFSLIPLMYLFFSYLMNNYSSNAHLRSLGTFVYILHPFFIVVMHFIKGIIPISLLDNSLINYILVSILTLIASVVLDIIIKKINVYNTSKV